MPQHTLWAFRYHVNDFMLIAKPTNRQLWQPRLEAEKEIVRSELEAVLKSPQFANSKRYPAFLRYVVETTLEGGAAHIKERTIGIEVFGRSNDYDTNNDTVVRYTAGEVRKRLAIYYHEHESSAVQIGIPQGSYVPEFLYREGEDELAAPVLTAGLPVTPLAASEASVAARAFPQKTWSTAFGIGLLVALVVAAGMGALWYGMHRFSRTAFQEFWDPILQEKSMPLIVSGSVVFSPNPYSGTETAVRTDDYPFVSIQTAAALTRVSGLLQQKPGGYQMQPANVVTLSDLRDRSLILVGGYNNEWTLRLVQGRRFHMGSVAAPAILDSGDPGRIWQRDHRLPYASSDDYALIGRFHDATTGGLVVVIAGLGRNGTEAAAQFVTDPHYMDLLEQRLGRRIGNQNLEAVLKINVVQGRTGAPSLEDVIAW